MSSPVVVIGNPESNRVGFLQEALASLGREPAIVVPWREVLAEAPLPNPSPEERGFQIRNVVKAYISFPTLPLLWGGPGRGASRPTLRIESPGRNFEAECALLELGADVVDECGDPEGRLSKADCALLTDDKGLIRYPRQWYLGFCAALEMIEAQLEDAPPHTLMNSPRDIAVMFDKRLCHARLKAAGIPVPGSLGPIGSYNELVSRMRETGCPRVFVKLAHGSSASGVVALQMNDLRCQATTTVEMIEDDAGGPPRLYNSRRIRTYSDAGQIAQLIDALCVHGVHVEQWLPKAGMDGRTLDLRVVVIAGEARHVVARMSRSPITNLHLLNQRGDPNAIRQRMGEAAWQAAMRTCEQTMQCFPNSLYAGIDLLITSDFKRHAVLEVNAFGDLLPGILSDGQDTYTAELLKAI